LGDEKQSRKEYMDRYYAENKAEISEQRKAIRQARQEEINAADRARYANDPAAREQRLRIKTKNRQTQIERIATDPEAKKKHEERLTIRRQLHKERLATDPEYRKLRDSYNANQREKRQKQNLEKQKSAGDEP